MPNARDVLEPADVIYDGIRDLPVIIDEVVLDRLELAVSPAFTRVTTLVVLRGAGHEGIGEDVTYEADEAVAFAIHGPPELRGTWTIHSLSEALGSMNLFPIAPNWAPSRDYRRWAFESAALDLGLRQAGEPLWRVLGEECAPVEFVISIGLGNPPDPSVVLRWAEAAPGMAFKLDATPSWTRDLAQSLNEVVDVDVIDLKGHYTGSPVDTAADPALYAMIAEEFPNAWLEDPLVDDRTCIALAGAEDRVTWDAPLHCVDDIAAQAIAARTINIKPSRVGSLERLMAMYDHVREHGMGAYGGGQYELGPGRDHIQYLASMFHPDAPNDTSPVHYHRPPHAGAPTSPITPAPAPTGFRWDNRD